MNKRDMLKYTSLAAGLMLSTAAFAQETVKIGVILPMTGPFASTGKQIETAMKLYLAQKGATVAGKRIELVLKDDTGNADTPSAWRRKWSSMTRSPCWQALA